ncbi:MAG: UDP-glucose 4-epimerase GalE [Calditrichaeota bacterium]|nr:UDP-glucose 4-epimerase GalE [Calditrichota bacterium]
MSETYRILVTGGAGYIGSHVVHYLVESGHRVIVLDNLSLGRKENLPPDAELVTGDVLNDRDLEKVFEKGIDVVFHFAAWKAAGESMTKPDKYGRNNICGSINLLNACLTYDVKNFVFSSSAAVYGDPQYLPVDESHPLKPVNYYGYTKLAIEENLKWYSQLKGIRYAALRYFNATGYDIKGRVKGKEKNPANLSPVVMETIAGVRDEMQVFGNDYDTPDGTCIRDYIHVNDLAAAHAKAMDYLLEKKQNLVVNLGTGKGHTVLEVIKAAQRVSGKKVNYRITGRRAGDPPELVASCDLAYKLLGWKAKYSDLETIFGSMLPVYL